MAPSDSPSFDEDLTSGRLALGDSAGAITFPPVQWADLSAAHHAASAIDSMV